MKMQDCICEEDGLTTVITTALTVHTALTRVLDFCFCF